MKEKRREISVRKEKRIKKKEIADVIVGCRNDTNVYVNYSFSYRKTKEERRK